MRYRTFPGTSVTASEVGFGTWTLATNWWGEKTDTEAIAMLKSAHDDYGVTFFDAADTYSNGRAERQLATAFRGRRGQVVYATKIGYDIYDEAAQQARRGQSELPMRTDPAYLRLALDRCLERLDTDYVDVLQIHNAKMEHVRDAALWDTLRDFQREGKVRVWGAAFGPAIGWLYEAVELCEREPDVGAIQMIWNVLEQHPGSAMIEAARRHAPQCAFTIRVPHASGMLEGHYTEDTVFPEHDHRRHRPRSWLVNGVKKVRTLDFLTPRMTLGQAALKWLLADPLVVTTLPNIYDTAQLREFATTSEQPDLTPAQLDQVARLAEANFGVDEPPMAYKGTMERENAASA
jgi:aryl-alcohol dehydrogenase-like predicted oxidoreductase